MAAAEALTDMNDDFLLLSITERFLKEAAERNVSHETTMEFAWCMVRSPKLDDIRRGLDHIRRLLGCQIHDIEVYKRCFYILAVGNARLKNYPDSLQAINNLRQADPDDPAWMELKKAIVKHGAQGEAHCNGVEAGYGRIGTGIGLVVVGIMAFVAFRFLRQ